MHLPPIRFKNILPEYSTLPGIFPFLSLILYNPFVDNIRRLML